MITHVYNNATDIITTHPHRSHSVVASCWPHCHKYKMNSEEQNEIQNRLFSWHKKKNIKCPSCKSPLFHFDGRPYFSSAHIVNEIVVLHHSPCTSSIGNCGKALFFCLSCGSQSSHTSGRLQDKGCKCVRRNDNNKVSEDHPKNMTTWERGDNNAEILKDLVGYGLGDTSQPDSDRRCDSQVDATMGKETNPTEESGVSNDHLLGYEDGGNGKLNSIPQVAQEFLTRLVLFLVILIPTTPSIFWETVMNGLLLVRDFL